MDRSSLELLLKQFGSGEMSQGDLMKHLDSLFVLDLGFAKLDTHRSLRQGFPEVIYGPKKTAEQVGEIVGALIAQDEEGTVLLTRATEAQVERAGQIAGQPEVFYHGSDLADSKYCTAIWNRSRKRVPGRVCIVSAGTGDLSVATEVEATLYAFGVDSDLVSDCGVAGIHRLFDQLERIKSADVIVVVAGMEGALASVVGGLVRAPIIAVPTSTGYGASLEGVTALLSMLASCAPGIMVVGIDNGFGAAVSAIRILDCAYSDVSGH